MKYSEKMVEHYYKELLSVRMAEEKLVEIYAQGRVPGHIHSGVGEEAAYVGPLMTRNETDYYKGTHRVVSAVHAVGVTFNEIFAEILGKQTGTSHGRGGVNHIARLDKGVIALPALWVWILRSPSVRAFPPSIWRTAVSSTATMATVPTAAAMSTRP